MLCIQNWIKFNQELTSNVLGDYLGKTDYNPLPASLCAHSITSTLRVFKPPCCDSHCRCHIPRKKDLTPCAKIGISFLYSLSLMIMITLSGSGFHD